MRAIWIIVLAISVAASAACGGGRTMPVVGQVHPAEVTPGAFLMLSGARLDRVATVSIGGRLAADVTVITPGLLTAVTPAGLGAGPQPLELRATDGRTIHGAVTVAALPAPPRAAPQPQATPAPSETPPPATVTPTRTPAPATTSPRGRDEGKEDKQEKKPGQGPPPGRGRGR